MTQENSWKIFPKYMILNKNWNLRFSGDDSEGFLENFSRQNFCFVFELFQILLDLVLKAEKTSEILSRGKTINGKNLNRWKGMKNWIIHNLWIIALRADYSRMRCAAACITTHAYLSSTSIFVRSNIATWSTSSLDSGPWKCSISDSHWCRRAFHRLSTETLSYTE